MAKPRRSKIQTVDNPKAGDELLADQSAGRSPVERAAEQDEIEILNQLRDEAGNGGYVRLSRRMEGSMDYAIVAKVPIADYSVDRVQMVYGGGYYRLRFCTEDHKICGQRQLIIDPNIPPKNPAAPAPVPVPAAAPAGTDLVALVKELANRPAAAGGGTAEVMPLILAMIQSQSQLLQAVLTKKPEDGGTNTVLLEMLKMERERAKERTPISELMDNFHAFKKITGGKAGDDDDEPLSIWDKAGKVLGPIAEGLAAKYLIGGGDEIQPRRMIDAPGEPTTAAPAESNGALPGAAVPLAPVHPFPKPAPTTTPMNAIVQMQVNRLMLAAVAAAKKNADPAEFAKELMDEIPPKFYEQVESMAKTDNWFETLFGKSAPGGAMSYHPDALAAREWLTKMRDSLLAELGEVLGPEEAAPGGN